MKVTSHQLLNTNLGDSQLTIFHLVDEEDCILTVQEKDSVLAAVVGREPNGEVELVPEAQGPIESQVTIISNVSFKELEKLGNEINKIVEQEKLRNSGS